MKIALGNEARAEALTDDVTGLAPGAPVSAARRRNVLWLSAGAVAMALVAGCGAQPAGTEVDEMGQPVQIEFVSFNDQTSTSRWVNLLFSDSQSTGGKTVGAIRLHSVTSPFPWYTCGSTFISPTYAITAAHCVARSDVAAGGTFKIEQFNTTNLFTLDGILKLSSQSHVSGTWPNWTRTTTLSSSDGYVVTSYTDCKVVVGCDSMYVRTSEPNSNGEKACPFTQDVDIALVRCPSRANNSTYVNSYTAVRSDDSSDKQVEVWWFHELLDLAGDPGEETSSQPTGNWSHYGQRTTPITDNYHYSTGTSQMVPLRSTTWPDGTFYKQLGNVDSETTKTDVPSCHGTSGSAVFERGTTGLFGPVVTYGAQSALSDRVCEDMDSKSAGQHLMTHIRATWSRQIEAMSIVATDRGS